MPPFPLAKRFCFERTRKPPFREEEEEEEEEEERDLATNERIIMLLRIRTRDGTERLHIPDDDESTTTKISDVQKRIAEEAWGVPIDAQSLSTDPTHLLLTTTTTNTTTTNNHLLGPEQTLSALGVRDGDILYMRYDTVERRATKSKIPGASLHSGKPFGETRTIEAMISEQTRIGRQDEGPHVASVSFCGHAANAFQSYVNNTLGFRQSRFGWLYGTKTTKKTSKKTTKEKKGKEEESGERVATTELFADVIYEPKQTGNAFVARFDEDDEESQTAEAIARAMGYERIGCVFNQSDADRGDESVSAMSAHEVTLCAKLQAKYGKEFVAVIVMQFEDENEEMQVTFEAFQVSDQCVKLYEEGFFELDEESGVAKLPPSSSSSGTGEEEKENKESTSSFSNWGSHTKMVKPVMVERKDVTEVDNDFWLVAVPIKDHAGTSQSGFPIENRLHPPQNVDDIRSAIKSRPGSSYAEKLRDFHLLLFLCKQMDKNDVVAIAKSTNDYVDGGDVSEGYKVLIDAIAGIS